MGDVKKQMRESNKKVDCLSNKLEKMEKAQRRNEAEHKKEFKGLRKEMSDTKIEIETNVTQLVVEKLKPKIREIQTQCREDINKAVKDEQLQISSDIRRIVNEELELRKFKESKDKEDN